MVLPYAPRTPAGLPQSVQGIPGFVEEDRRKLQQVESGFDQLGMADDDVDSALQLLAVPGLAFRRRSPVARSCPVAASCSMVLLSSTCLLSTRSRFCRFFL